MEIWAGPSTAITCQSLSTTWEAAGGHPAGGGSSQLQALPGLGRASKTPKSPSLASQTFLTRVAASSRCSGKVFFSKLGRKSLWDHDKRQGDLPQKAAGIRPEPPPMMWHRMEMLAGKEGCQGGIRGAGRGSGMPKPTEQSDVTIQSSVPWAGGMRRVVRTQPCKNHLHWPLGTTPQRVWSQPGLCTDNPHFSYFKSPCSESL